MARTHRTVIKTLVTRFGNAAQELAWNGSNPPEFRDEIYEQYAEARTRLEAEAFRTGDIVVAIKNLIATQPDSQLLQELKEILNA